MTSHSEWGMLCIAEDIEPGDSVVIEHLKTEGYQKTLIYTGLSDDDEWVFCKENDNKKEYVFNAESLDEKGKRTKKWRLLKKSPVALRFKASVKQQN
jgi:hypothetical protein